MTVNISNNLLCTTPTLLIPYRETVRLLHTPPVVATKGDYYIFRGCFTCNYAVSDCDRSLTCTLSPLVLTCRTLACYAPLSATSSESGHKRTYHSHSQHIHHNKNTPSNIHPRCHNNYRYCQHKQNS